MEVSIPFGTLPQTTEKSPPDASRSFRILVLGDFGAADAWGKPVTVDRDDLDLVFARMNVTANVPLNESGPEFTVPLGSMESFHPDELYRDLELFEALRTRRRRLQNDATFDEEAAAIVRSSGVTETEQPAASDEPSDSADNADLLSQAIEGAQSAQEPVGRQIAQGSLNIDDYVRQLVEPFVLQKEDPRKPEFIAGVDRAIAEAMRRLMHSPGFRRIEAAWRGVEFLTRRLETNARLSISIMNVPGHILGDDLLAGDDLSRSKLFKHIVDATSVDGAEPWTLIVGDYSFAAEDAELVGRLARISSAAGAVFVASASSSVVGCTSFGDSADPDDWNPAPTDENWTRMRGLAESRHVVLTLPRLLARRPYGAKSDPIDSFTFDEIPDGDCHDSYLWMSSAFAVATIVGHAFSRSGWNLSPSISPQLDGLPLHVYKEAGESVIKPCAETELSLRAGETLTGRGVTVLYSVRDSADVRCGNIRSLATDGSLAAAWT